MILSEEIIIDSADNLTSEYVETKLKEIVFDVLRWSITHFEGNCYTINVSHIVK